MHAVSASAVAHAIDRFLRRPLMGHHPARRGAGAGHRVRGPDPSGTADGSEPLVRPRPGQATRRTKELPVEMWNALIEGPLVQGPLVDIGGILNFLQIGQFQ
ncbi:hypothetical protein GCM10025875_13320 [Litorihabitans aurantiacus]|uniref:Uncharacterized protein n=1 Tax=Litorihabitans aurantiacus TaxID=1930061 RepID=A0AA37UUG3_9MICO|nr:hypothetical protein GCM10025875_13320 [Litorihabitans aurantiacus]